jgi:steroid 5-alpha reductase family enzyme
MKDRPTGIFVTVFAYLLALATAILTGNLFSSFHPLVMIAVADLMATIIIFFFSLALNNSSMYDPYWSVKPMVIAGYYFIAFFPGEVPVRQILVLALMLLYGIRLTSNFYRDWPGLSHEDWRYRNFRKQFPKLYWPVSFFGIHFFPTLMVYLSCLPMYGAMAHGGNPLNPWDLAASIVLAGSIIIAFLADEQLRNFRKDPANKGNFIQSGLWKRIRHPNYLGEILTWWGLFMFALAAGYEYWWTGIGAVCITLMFVFISVPMMQKKNLASKPGYADYIKRTGMLFPVVSSQ